MDLKRNRPAVLEERGIKYELPDRDKTMAIARAKWSESAG